MFPGCLQDFSRIFSGCSDWVLWAWWNLMIISNESMVFNDPKELDDPQLFDGPQRWYLHHWWSCYLLQSEFMGSTFNYQSDTDLCTGQTGGPPALRLPCVQDQATRSHLHSDWLGSPLVLKKWVGSLNSQCLVESRLPHQFSGPTYVWTFTLKTKSKPSKWVLAGVGLLLQI